jgi:hypothetical protein
VERERTLCGTNCRLFWIGANRRKQPHLPTTAHTQTPSLVSEARTALSLGPSLVQCSLPA